MKKEVLLLPTGNCFNPRSVISQNTTFIAACLDLMSVGDTDFSPPTTAVNLVLGDSSRHLQRWENSHLFS